MAVSTLSSILPALFVALALLILAAVAATVWSPAFRARFGRAFGWSLAITFAALMLIAATYDVTHGSYFAGFLAAVSGVYAIAWWRLRSAARPRPPISSADNASEPPPPPET